MGLIRVNGTDPFAGQKDPFVGLDVSYEDFSQEGSCGGPEPTQKTAVYKVGLDGTLTGCSFTEVDNLRQSLTESFTQNLIESFSVEGLSLPSDGVDVTLEGISFSASSYLSYLPYSINLVIKKRLNEESVIANKSHSVDFSIPAKGDNTVTYRIGAEGVETGDCMGLQHAIDWVTTNDLVGINGNGQGLLKYNGMGTVLNPEQELALTSQGETIDRASNNYSRNYSFVASDGDEMRVKHDSSINIRSDLDCNFDITGYRGTFSFKTDGNIGTVDYDKQKLLNAYNQYSNSILPQDGRQEDVTYDSGNNSLSYSFENPQEWEGSLQVIYNYSLSLNKPEMGELEIGVNGTAEVHVGPLSGRKEKLDSISDNEVVETITHFAATGIGAAVIRESANVDRDNYLGTISYGGQFRKASAHNDVSVDGLDGVSGLTSYSLNLQLPIRKFTQYHTLNCLPLILDRKTNTRALLSVSLQGISGTGQLGTTQAEITGTLERYARQRKDELATAPEAEAAEIPSFDIDSNGCVSYSQTFSWNSKNTANSEEEPLGITSNLRA